MYIEITDPLHWSPSPTTKQWKRIRFALNSQPMISLPLTSVRALFGVMIPYQQEAYSEKNYPLQNIIAAFFFLTSVTSTKPLNALSVINKMLLLINLESTTI